MDSTPGEGTKILQATQHKQKRMLSFILNAQVHGRPIRSFQQGKYQLYIFKRLPACGLNNLLLLSNTEQREEELKRERERKGVTSWKTGRWQSMKYGTYQTTPKELNPSNK